MLIVYHKLKINSDLLKPDRIKLDQSGQSPFTSYLKGYEKTTLPAGKLVGITYNPYHFEEPITASPYPIGASEGRSALSVSQVSPILGLWSQTDIRMTDSQSREITAITDLSDYRHKSGGHVVGFKNVYMENDADTVIKVEWETLGTKPMCGEFVFLIEQENCECS